MIYLYCECADVQSSVGESVKEIVTEKERGLLGWGKQNKKGGGGRIKTDVRY